MADDDEVTETFGVIDLAPAASGGVSPEDALRFCRHRAEKRCGILGVLWVHASQDYDQGTVTCKYACGRVL